MMNRNPSAPAMGGSPMAPAAAASNTAAMQPAVGIPQPGPMAAAPAGIPTMPGVSQGPLAFLEQTTSNIGSIPRGMGGTWNTEIRLDKEKMVIRLTHQNGPDSNFLIFKFKKIRKKAFELHFLSP